MQLDVSLGSNDSFFESLFFVEIKVVEEGVVVMPVAG